MKQKILLKKEENKTEKENIVEDEKQEFSITKKQNAFILSLIFLSSLIVLLVQWIFATTGNVTLEQLLFHLKVPIKGTNTGMIWDCIDWMIPKVISITLAFGIIMLILEEIERINQRKLKEILYFIAKFTITASILFVLIVMNVFGFIKNQITASKLIEKEYIDPSQAKITFPEQKKNLIYIYLESMENTYTSIENGGLYEVDRIPELAQIAQNNISFSNTEKLGGAINLLGTQWTIAAMVAQTSGVPLKITIGDNDYGKHSSFLPGAYTLGEVLEKNGYTNYLIIGSEAEFGGRKQYFESHGNYNIWDYNTAVDEGKKQVGDFVWWGYADKDLFEYAKEQLTEISQKGEPFNYTMLTVDTHFTDGYVCDLCDSTLYEDHYSNVIRCSSKQVNQFVEWIKQQPFYENTTIIISGDHLTMQADIETQVKEKGYGERSVYNAFINSEAQTTNLTNRKFFTVDMYPTTLAALGAKIEGEKLGLGTNLFSQEKTIAEKYGVDLVREELEKKSIFYNKKIIYNEK